MKTLATFLIGAFGPWLVSVALAADPTPADLRAAQCVAALDANTRDLAARVLAGDDKLRPMLMDRLVAGAAFIGDSYLHSSVAEEQAKALTDRAREAQKSLPARALAERQAACADEGSRIYEAGNGLQQMVLKHLARKRMNKLLGT